MALVIRADDLSQSRAALESGGEGDRFQRLPSIDDVREQAKAKGIDPDFAVSIFQQESGANPKVKPSPKGAVGPMQVMPGTFKSVMGDDGDINDPWDNLEAGLRYIQYGQKKLGTNDAKLLAAGYHQGYDRPELKRGEIANTSDGLIRTPDYARSVVARMGTKGGTIVAPTPLGGEASPGEAAIEPTDPQDRMMLGLARNGLRIAGTTPTPGGATAGAADDPGFMGWMKGEAGRQGRNLKIGWNSLLSAYHGIMASEFADLQDALEKTYTPEQIAADPKLRAEQESRRQFYDQHMNAVRQLSAESAELQQGSRPETRQFLDAKGKPFMEQLRQIGDALVKNPAGVITDLGVQSTPASMAMMASAVLARFGFRSPTAAAAAGGSASTMVEFGNDYAELRDQGMTHDEAWRQAMARAPIVGAFDAVSFRSAGHALENVLKANAAQKALIVGKEVGKQAGYGMAGEAVGTAASGRTPEPVDVIAEGVGEVFGAPGEAMSTFRRQRGVAQAAPTSGGSPADLARRGLSLESDTGAVPARDVFGGPAAEPAQPELRTRRGVAGGSEGADALLKNVDPTALDRIDQLEQRIAELKAAPAPATEEDAKGVADEVARLQAERDGLAKGFPRIERGSETEFQTETGADLKARYGLVEAGDLVTSHDENLRTNAAYPKELQPRDRERAASEVQVSSISQKLSPARLGESADAATGAPIVGADGVVESGNARSIALKRVYQADGDKAQGYRAWLAGNASRFGFSPEQVQGMKNPVLVRVRSTRVNRAEFARQANAPTTATMSPTEQARADAKRLDNLDDLAIGERGDIPFSKNQGFIKRFVGGLPLTEQAGLVTEAGELSQAGLTRIRNAVLGRAYGDSPTLMRMVESLDNNLRNITSALVRVAPAVAKARDSIAAGALHDADITADLVAAVEELSRIRERGATVASVLAQSEMFGLTLSPEAVELLQFLDANMRYPNKVAQFIENYLTALGAAGSPNQGSLLGESQAPAKRDIINAAKGRLDEEPGAAVPAGEATAGGETPASPAGAGEPREEARAGAAAADEPGGEKQAGEAGAAGRAGEDVAAKVRAAVAAPADEIARVLEVPEVQAELGLMKVDRASEDARNFARGWLAAEAGVSGDDLDVAAMAEVPTDAKGRFLDGVAAHGAEDLGVADAQADFDDALAELGEWVLQQPGVAMKMLPDAEKKKLLPILTRLFEASIKLGYVKFKDALAHVLKAIEGNEKLRALTAWLGEEDYKEAFDNAGKVRSDAGQVRPRRNVSAGGKGQGGADIQRAAQARPGASDAARDAGAGGGEEGRAQLGDVIEGLKAAKAKDAAADYGPNRIEKRTPALTGRAKEIEDKFSDWVWNHREEAMYDYRQRFGSYLATDAARELSPDYTATKEARSLYSPATHEPASWLVKQLYARMLAEPVPEGKEARVILMAGGTGAGKTTAIQSMRNAGPTIESANMLYDTNANNVASARQKIDAARAAGREVLMVYVYRDPVDALVKGALPRAMEEGRAVPLKDHAETHVGSATAIKEIAKEYADDEGVAVVALDNNHGIGGARPLAIEDVKPLAYNDIHGKLAAALERERASGRISESVYRGTLGAPAPEGVGGQGGEGNAAQPAAPRAPESAVGGKREAQRTDVPPARGERGNARGGEKAGSSPAVDRGQMGLDFAAEPAPAREGEEAARTPEPAGERGGGGNLGREDGRQEQRRAGQRDSGAGGDRPGPVAGPTDYTITDVDQIGAGGAKTKARGNLAAIRLLKTLTNEDRLATPAEQSVLVKYVGWGGLKQVFDEKNAEWAPERDELKALLSEDEYAAARRSVLDAHYTSKTVVDGIYAGLARLGFTGGAVLEPAAGVGHFIGLMPGELRAYTRFTAVELDPITGGIAKQLYQKSDINPGQGFQNFRVREGWYDAAVGNPPFGETKVFDELHRDISKFSLHNFFFAKSVLALRPGGVLAMVVSNFFLDANRYDARAWIAQHAELLGAIRLPNTAFKANAGTEVTTDIIFLKRREKDISEQDAKDEPWVMTGEIKEEGTGKPIPLNPYFIKNPKMMLGKMTLGGTMYARESAALEPLPGQDLAKALAEAVSKLPKNAYTPGTRSIEELTNVSGLVPEGVKVGGYFPLPDGRIAMRLEDVEGKSRSQHIPMKEKTRERVKGMIAVRDAMNNLMRSELRGDEERLTRNLRAELHRVYDGFVRKFGYLNDVANRRAFDRDPDAPRIEALEKDYDPGVSKDVAAREGIEPRKSSAAKADIFSKATQAPRQAIQKVENAKDALSASMGERGRIDFDYMTAISGRDKETLKAELVNLIFKNPDGDWEPADKYLSGNVKAKLAAALKAAARDPAYGPNAEALKRVQPADIEAVDIGVRMGSSWIPASDIADFIEAILKVRPNSISFQPALAKWFVEIPNTGSNEIKTVWGAETEDEHGGVHGWDARQIIKAVLNNTPVVVKENHGSKEQPNWVVMEAETRLAQQKAEDMRLKFNSWLWEDQARRERLVRKYNDTFNTNVLRVYDGSHLTLPGTNPAIQLSPNKKHSAWRMIQENNVLLDHVVGSGKTFTTAAGFMEMRRLGLMKKGMVVVPNHLVKQWRDEWYSLYPNANVLAASEQDFDKENRQRLFSRIATGDWDAVVVPHSSFIKIGMPAEMQRTILNEQIDDLTEAIESLKRDKKGRDPSVRQMEKVRERMKDRIDRLSAGTGRKDQAVTFDELGIDGLAVDEAHLFKNLFYYTQMRGVAGLGDPNGSARAFDLFVKVRYLNKISGRVVFATGTPVSNSLVEMFTMQRYMGYDDLRARGIHHLDSWAGVYGNITQVWEIDPSGQGSRLATRFARFVNLPELLTGYRTFADVLTLPDLHQQFKERTGKPFPVPKVKGGKPQNIVVERSPEQSIFFGVQEPVLDDAGKPRLDDKGRPLKKWNEGSILDRIENMPKDPHEDNMLKVTNDARFAGLDMRTLGGEYGDFKGSKINRAVDEILRIWKAWKKDKGAQLVFLDLSKPAEKKKAKAAPPAPAPVAEGELPEDKPTLTMDELLAGASRFSVYDDVKAKLIKAGIPESEIAFIHDANTAEQKKKLFGKVNRGEVRVLIGSTPKMGAGTNVQKRLVALHHLDAPWRPSDLEQREGRIIRQGNGLYERDPEGFEIEILRYATRQTYDTRMWQLLEHKARAIEQIRRGDFTARTTEDVDGEAANAAEMKAAVSGNPLIMQEIQLRTEVQKLEGLEQAFKRQRFSLQSRVTQLEDADKRLADTRAMVAPYIAARKPAQAEGFTFTTADGKKVTTPEGLATPLSEAMTTAINSKDMAYAGEYRGLHLFFRFYIDWRRDKVVEVGASTKKDPEGNYWQLTDYRAGQDFSPSGFITRMNNGLDKFEDTVKEAELRHAREKEELAKAKAELAHQWGRADELERARAEHRRVLALIDAGETGEATPVQPPPDAELAPKLSQATWRLLTSTPAAAEDRGITVDEAQEVVDRAIGHIKNIASGGVHVVTTTDELPKHLRDYLRSKGDDALTEGLFDPRTQAVYLIANNVPSRERAQFVIWHELYGHYGLRGVFGDKLNSVLGDIWIKNNNVRREAEELMHKFGYSQALAIEEALANMAGRGETFGGFRKLMAKIQELLHEWGFGELAAFLENLTDAEALQVLSQARQWVTGGVDPHAYTSKVGPPAFKRADAKDFDEWFSGSAMVRNGEPIIFYRGEWGGSPGRNPFQNTSFVANTPTFTDNPRVASIYAMSPNYLSLNGGQREVERGRVGYYYLAIKNPLELNEGEEDVTEIGHLRKKLRVGDKVGAGEFKALVDSLKWRYDGNELATNADRRDLGENEEYAYTDSYRLANSPLMLELAKKAGYDGYTYYGPSHDENDHFQAFEVRPFRPSQIRGVFRRDVPLRSQEAAPAWFSDLHRRLVAVKQASAPVGQWKAIIANLTQKGVKQDEIEWSGINDWLDTHTGNVAKEAVLDYLAKNGVRVEETLLGGDEGDGKTAESDRLRVQLDALGYDTEEDHEGLVTITRRADGEIFHYANEGIGGEEGFFDPRGEFAPANVNDLAMRLGRALEDEGETIDTRDRNATRYKTYTLPGGENYRELLLTLPEAKQEGRAGTVTFADDDPVDDFLTDLAAGSLSVDEMDYGAIEENGRRNKVKFDGLMPEEAIEFQKLAARYNGRVVYKPASKPAPAFRSSHFYEENVLAHVRFDDRTDANGNKVLFIEEIQSDWAQAGRKRGFGDAAKKLPAGYTLKTDGGNWWVENAAGKMVNPYKRPSRAEAIGEAINGRSSGEQYHRNLEDGKSIPAGPFVTKTEAWAGLALRRIIRWAAERGYDSVAWTTGDQQAERYDLSKHVRDLHYAKHGDTYWLAATLHNGKEHGFGNAIEPDKLDDYVGKAVAEKIRNGEGAKHPTDTSRRTLRGLDLKVGGKGMRAFYDKIVPNVANDILKKMGGGKVGKVGVIGINATSDDDLGNPVEQPGFDITPALREAAMGGMPLFSKSEHRIGTAGATARGARDELPGKTPAPAPDESFVVYRVGTAPSLLNRNAGNANAVARHLLAHDSVDLPVGAGIGDTIMAFRVTAKKFGAYEGMRGGKPSQADGVGRVVRGKEVAYSFPEGAWWEGELIDSIPVSEVRNVLRHRGVRDASFDEAGTDAGADAIRRAFDRRANFEADKRAQVAWLNAQAGKLGYWDAEELATKDPAAFQRFAEEWRAKTPTALFSRRSAPASPAQQAADRLASRSSRFRPVEAVTKAAVQVVGLDRASGWAYDKLLELIARLTPEKVKAGVVADFGIPEAVTDRRVAMQAAQRQHLREVEKVIAALGGLTRAESRVAYEWMNADNPQAADYFRDQLPPESIAVLADVEKMVDQLSAEAIRLGQMTADERERNRFAYLRRSYVKHTAELTGQERARRSRAIAVFGDQYKGRGIADAVPMSKVQNLAPEFWKRKLKGRRADASLRGEKFIRLERRAPAPGAGSAPLEGIGPAQAGQGRLLEVIYWPAAEEVPARYSGWEQSGPTWEVRGTKGENLVMWRDFTKAEREQMGEIDEIKYAVARTMQGMIHDVETGRYLEWLANTQARPNANHIPAGKIIEAKESLWHTFARDEWVQVPDSKIPGTSVLRYGKLAGKYLPGPIWNDVRQTVNQNFQPLGEYYAAVLRAWKVSKTALSPAVHMNNVMANVVMADWHDVGAGQILKALDILIHQDNPANKIIVDRFEDAGGSIGTFSISELQREQLAPLIEQLRRDMGQGGDAGMIGAVAALQLALSGKFREALSAAASSKAARGVEVAAKAMIDLYQTEDVVFRLAAFIRAKEDGSSDRDAGKLARQSFLDYHINAPWIQMMRSTALPFVSFTYRAAPMLLEIAAKKPWKLLKLALFAGALNAIGYAFSGGDEDKERKLLPEEKAGRIFGFLVPKLIRMPWNDAHGSPVFLDIRRWIPVGDIFDTGQTHSAVPVLPMAIPGGPLAVLAELLFNRSQFTGREITKDTDTGVEKAKKVFDHLYKAIAPNLLGLPGTYATKGVVDAATGKTDAFGREQGTAQAILSSVGVKVAAYPGDVGMKNLRAKRDHDLREISETMSALRRERAKNGISQSDFEKRMAEQVAKREKVNREFAGKLN